MASDPVGANGRTIINLQKRDLVATVLVAVAAVIYVCWLEDAVPQAMSGVRATGIVVLALGFAASATAVVPTFAQLLHGNRWYVAVTSVIGLAALVSGVMVFVASSEAALAVVVVAMLILWAISTTHHSILARRAPSSESRVTHPVEPRVTI